MTDNELRGQKAESEELSVKGPVDYLSPAGLIATAREADPNFRYALAIAGILGIVVTFAKFGISLLTLILGAVVVVVLMVLYVIFAQVTRLARQSMAVPAKALVWIALTIVIVVLVCLTTSIFFNGPLPLRNWIIRQLGVTTTPEGGDGESNKLQDKGNHAAAEQFRRFLVGRWSAHQVVAQTGYQFESVISFSENGAFTENDYGSPPLAMAGSWTVTPLSEDTFSLTIVLPVGTWTYSLQKLDDNKFKNQVLGYTAYRVSK